MFDELIAKFKEILEGITDSDSETVIQEVFNHEIPKFEGDPVAIIVPSYNESDYNTTEENMRVYSFAVTLFVKRTSPRNPSDADKIMRGLVKRVIDTFDKYYTLRATGTDGSSTPGGAIENSAGYTFISLFATPSAWGYSGDMDEYRTAEITVRCRVSVSLSQIS